MENNYSTSILEVTKSLESLSLPKEPSSFGEKYAFPEEVTKSSLIEIGRWMFKLAAWRSYCLRLLSHEELEYNILKKSFDLGVNNTAFELEKKQEKKSTKDFLISNTIVNNVAFKKVQVQLIEKESKIKALLRLLDMYQIQADCISRELTRRDLELKTSR